MKFWQFLFVWNELIESAVFIKIWLILLLGRRLDLVYLVIRLVLLLVFLELQNAYGSDAVVEFELGDVIFIELQEARDAVALWTQLSSRHVLYPWIDIAD